MRLLKRLIEIERVGVKTLGLAVFLAVEKYYAVEMIFYRAEGHVCCRHMKNWHVPSDPPIQEMSSNNCSSGNWGPKQDKDLGDYLCANTIHYRIRTADYHFGVMEQFFPDFMFPGASGRNAAIQCMQCKFLRNKQDLLSRCGKFLLM
jgi:hypothetical protein